MKRTLREMPKWEPALSNKHESRTRTEWKNAPASFDGATLEILGHAVMEDWETPYMKVLAEIAFSASRPGNGGTILEVGFGMGISAGFIQEHAIGLHLIIEANREVVVKALEFGRSAQHPVFVLAGFWESACKLIPDFSLDGILFDTYPLNDRELYANHYRFFRSAYRMLRPGGVLTYYSDEENGFSADHVKRLARAGFTHLAGRVVDVEPPPGCEYWQAKTIFAPIVVK